MQTTTPPRRLTRSRTDRKVAGVAGGIGRHLGIDPVIVRIGFVIALFAGLSGLLLYVVAWVLMPDDDGAPAAPSSPDANGLVAALGVAVVVIGLAAAFDDGPLDGLLLPLACIAFGGWLLHRSRSEEVRSSAEFGPDPSSEAGWATAGSPGPMPSPVSADVDEIRTAAPWPPRPTATTASSTTAGTAAGGLWTPPPDPSSHPSWPTGPAADGPSTSSPIDATWSARPSGPPTGMLTLAVVIMLLGIGGLVAGAQTQVGLDHVLVAALAATGLGLLVGMVTGRARGLVFLAAPLLAVLGAVRAIDVPLEGGVGERQVVVDDAADVLDPQRLLAGSLVIDLSALAADEDLDYAVEASVGVGELIVETPPGVTVVVTATASAGSLVLFGETTDGTGLTTTEVREGPRRNGRIELDLRTTLGEIVVR